MKTLAKDILSELYYSRNHGTVVGLKLKNTDQLIVSKVISVGHDSEVVIEDTSVYGNHLAKSHFFVEEIAGVLRFRAQYNDPEFVKLRQIKKTILVLKDDYRIKKSDHHLRKTC